MFIQVFIPFLDNGGINAGAVAGAVVGGIVLIIFTVAVLVYCCIKKGKFVSLLNQVTRFAGQPYLICCSNNTDVRYSITDSKLCAGF